MQKNTWIGLLVLIVILGGGYYIYTNKFSSTKYNTATTPTKTTPTSTNSAQNTNTNINTATTTPSQGNTTQNPTPTNSTVYNSQNVSKHNRASDCWSIVSGNVYDLTSWIARHPGGQSAIISMCGVDSTSSFMDQHGGQGRPEYELAKYLLGPLVK